MRVPIITKLTNGRELYIKLIQVVISNYDAYQRSTNIKLFQALIINY